MLVAHGDPLARQAVVDLHRWSVEVWIAANQKDSRAFSLPQLTAKWEASTGHKSKDSWRTARGLMAIARLEASRLGLMFQGPFKLVTATGTTVSLIEIAPNMIQTMAVQAHHVKLEQKAAINLGRRTWTPTESCCSQ